MTNETQSHGREYVILFVISSNEKNCGIFINHHPNLRRANEVIDDMVVSRIYRS